MKNFFNGFNSYLNMNRGLEADMRQHEASEYARRARERARLIEEHYLNQEATGELGNARLANILDAERASMLDPSGMFLGALGGQMLFHNGDGHHLVYGRAGSGKGTTSVQPALAHDATSMFVNDLKDGELYFSTAAHRAETLGHTIINIDPWGIHGGTSVRINPLNRLSRITKRGALIDAEADEIVLIMMPRGPGDQGDNAWTRKGARRLMTMRMKDVAYRDPDALTLSNIWRFVNCSDAELEVAFTEMTLSTHEDVSGPAAAMKSVFQEAPKQFEAYRAECIEALSPYSPGSALAHATSGNDFNFGRMKNERITAFLGVPSPKLGVAASWLGMLFNHAIEELAAEVGPSKVRFLVDECAQLPVVPAVMKCMRLYRGRGMLLSLYCQGRYSLRDAGYSESAVKEIEDQAACMQMWGVEDPSLLRDVEYWSGNKSIVEVNPSHSGGQIASSSLGRSERPRKVLQVEDIRLINEGQQIIKLPGYPLFVADRVAYWQVDPWKSQIRDVRELHFGKRF